MLKGPPLDTAISEAAVWRRTSCDCCRIRKEKCVGEPPCTKCASRNVKCTFKAAPGRRRSSRTRIGPLRRSQPLKPTESSSRPRRREVVLVACEQCRGCWKKCSGGVPTCAYCETRGLECIYNTHRDRSRGGGHSESHPSHPSPSERVFAEAEPDKDDTGDHSTQMWAGVDGADPSPEELARSKPVTQPSVVNEEEDQSPSSPHSSDYADSEDSFCEEDDVNLTEPEGFSFLTTSTLTFATWTSFPTPYHPSSHTPHHRISIQDLLQHESTESHIPISDMRSERPTPSLPSPVTSFSEGGRSCCPRICTDSPLTGSDILYQQSPSLSGGRET